MIKVLFLNKISQLCSVSCTMIILKKLYNENCSLVIIIAEYLREKRSLF